MSNVEITTLPSGLRVVTVNLPLKTAVTAAFVKTGSRYESKDINGISHFLEHMAFKGTRSRSAFNIANQIERIGSSINAFTSKEMTAYYVSSLPEHIEKSLDIISDVLLNSAFPQDELNTERGVVLQEIARSYDNPMHLAYDFYDLAAYPNQNYGRTILGDPEFIKVVTRDDFNSYMEKHYTAGNMLVVCAGNVDHKEFTQLVSEYFAMTPLGNVSIPAKATYVGGYKHYNKNFEQANIVLGFPSYTVREEDHIVAEVLDGVLGGGMSSPLFTEVREKRGLVYSVRSMVEHGSDYGNFAIYAGTTPELVTEFFDVACGELKKLIDSINPEDLFRTKNQLKSRILMKQDRPFSVAMEVVEDLCIFGNIRDVNERVRKIDEVSVDQLKVTAAKIFSSVPTLCIVGNIEREDYYDHVVQLMK